MTVTFADGFSAAGISAGLKAKKDKDLALVLNEGPKFSCAAIFTENRAKANPVLWSQKIVADGKAKAILLNSGGANCFTGEYGYETTKLSAQKVAQVFGFAAEDVIVCSTGIIGHCDSKFRNNIVSNIPRFSLEVKNSIDSGRDAASAILTTDSKPKLATYQGKGWRIGAMTKGAGMLAPALATMLTVITTDADLADIELKHALEVAAETTFNRLDSDGCMSTNDQITIMSSGASKTIPNLDDFTKALTEVCADLVRQLQDDAEGASHNINIEVVNAYSESDALEVARSIARSNLFKAAIYGNDPNWGRIIAAIGTTKANFNPYRVSITINGVEVCDNGERKKPESEVDLTPKDTHILLNLKSGRYSGVIYTNDLTKEYVIENSEYSS